LVEIKSMENETKYNEIELESSERSLLTKITCFEIFGIKNGFLIIYKNNLNIKENQKINLTYLSNLRPVVKEIY